MLDEIWLVWSTGWCWCFFGCMIVKQRPWQMHCQKLKIWNFIETLWIISLEYCQWLGWKSYPGVHSIAWEPSDLPGNKAILDVTRYGVLYTSNLRSLRRPRRLSPHTGFPVPISALFSSSWFVPDIWTDFMGWFIAISVWYQLRVQPTHSRPTCLSTSTISPKPYLRLFRHLQRRNIVHEAFDVWLQPHCESRTHTPYRGD